MLTILLILPGDSQSVIDALQSSAGSSTVPGGLDPASNVPLPAEASPQTSRELFRELSPACCPLPLPAPVLPHPAEGTPKTSPAAPASPEPSRTLAGAPSDSHSDEEKSTKWEQAQMGTGHSNEVGPTQEKLFFSTMPEEKDGKGLSGRASSLSTIPEGEKDDSFLGSRILKEIGKCLGEPETPAKSLKSASSSLFSTDLGSSSKQRGRMGGCQDSCFIKRGSPGIQRIWSWDESLARLDFQGDKGLSKTLSLSGSLKLGELLPVAVSSSEPIGTEKQRATFQVAGEPQKVQDPVRRSEPEGCNSITVNTNLPVFGKSGAGSSLCASEGLKEFHAMSSVKPLDNVSCPLGNVQQALEKAKEGLVSSGKCSEGFGESQGSKSAVRVSRKEMGSSHESGNSSSVDSLGIRVKTLLQLEHPTIEATPWVGEQEHCGSGQKPGSSGASSAFSRGDIGAQQSDNSSSLDSLAVRVRTLLEDERPVVHATQILQRAEEEEKKAHGRQLGGASLLGFQLYE